MLDHFMMLAYTSGNVCRQGVDSTATVVKEILHQGQPKIGRYFQQIRNLYRSLSFHSLWISYFFQNYSPQIVNQGIHSLSAIVS